jgi:hypothetical protein
MDGRGQTRFELPAPARLAHDIVWARVTLTGRRPRLDDLEEADRLAALLIDRWEPQRRRHRFLRRRPERRSERRHDGDAG